MTAHMTEAKGRELAASIVDQLVKDNFFGETFGPAAMDIVGEKLNDLIEQLDEREQEILHLSQQVRSGHDLSRLIVRRRNGEAIVIDEHIFVWIDNLNPGSSARLMIEAPRNVKVDRHEVHLAKRRELARCGESSRKIKLLEQEIAKLKSERSESQLEPC